MDIEVTDVVVSEWGNSLAVRIPKNAALRLGVIKGTHLRLRADDKGMHLSKPARRKKPRYTIEELMAGTTPKDYRKALSKDERKFWHTDVGREAIDE